MDRIKDVMAVILGGKLIVKGRDRTFAKAPLWLAVLCALFSPQLAVVTALLVVAYGMKAEIAKA